MTEKEFAVAWDIERLKKLNPGWDVRVFEDRNRPGTVKVNARNGARVLNLDRIRVEHVGNVSLELAWAGRVYLVAPVAA